MNKKIVVPLLVTLTPFFLHGACRRSVLSERQAADARIGTYANASFALNEPDGLLHVRDASESELRLRATAPNFTLTLTRARDEAGPLKLTIENLSPLATLAAQDGALLLTGPGQWTVNWVAPSITIRASELPTRPFVFLAMADIQEALPKLDDMVDAMNAETDAEFLVMAGDLTESTEPEQFDEYERRIARLHLPVFSTPGNHDVFLPDHYQRRFGRATYSFRHRGVRFTALDSASADVDPGAFTWLEEWLGASAHEGHVIFSHIPAIEYLGVRSGQWSSRRLARKFLSAAARAGVDLLLYGHIHSYDHYDSAGIPTYISGGGGAIPEAFDDIGRHYLRISVNPTDQSFGVEVRRVD